MNLILLGAPGAGKGTISQYLIEKYNFAQISTGDLIREEINSGSELGKKIKEITISGGLVDSNTVYSLITNKIKTLTSAGKSIIFDGFPRNVEQAIWLDGVLNIDQVMYLDCPLNVILERLTTRRVCPACKYTTNIRNDKQAAEGICAKCGGKLEIRPDDNPETIGKRYKTFVDNNQGIVDHYGKKVKKVDSSRGASYLQDVFDLLLKR